MVDGRRVCPEWVWLGTEASTAIQEGRKAGRREGQKEQMDKARPEVFRVQQN